MRSYRAASSHLDRSTGAVATRSTMPPHRSSTLSKHCASASFGTQSYRVPPRQPATQLTLLACLRRGPRPHAGWRRTAVPRYGATGAASHLLYVHPPQQQQWRSSSSSSHTRNEGSGPEVEAGDATAAGQQGSPSPPSKRRFAHRSGAAKRAVLTPMSPAAADGTAPPPLVRRPEAAAAAAAPTAPPRRPPPPSSPSPIPDRDNPRQQPRRDDQQRTSTPPPPSTGVTAPQLSIPVDFDVTTATPAALCSYLITLRRALRDRKPSTKNSRFGGRALRNLLMSQMPLLMQPPPGSSSCAVHEAVEPDGEADIADDDDEAWGGSPAREAAVRVESEGVSQPTLHRASSRGGGTMPWTNELAQQTVMCGIAVGSTLTMDWATNAAIEFLLHTARHDAAAATPSAATASAVAGSWTLDVGRVTAACDFAAKLLKHLQTMQRRRAVFAVTAPPLLRIHLARRSPPSPAGQAGGAVGVEGVLTGATYSTATWSVDTRTVPSRESQRSIETYVFHFLLPSLMDELRLFCAELERRHDEAAAATAVGAAGTSTVIDRACLCRLSVPEIDAFAALLSVFTQSLMKHCVRGGSGDGTIFFADVEDRKAEQAAAAAAAAGKEDHRRRVRRLPLRAYTIALASTVATLHDTVGPTTGTVERTVRRFARGVVAGDALPDRTFDAASPYRAWSSRHRSLGVAVSRQTPATAPAPHRFQQRGSDRLRGGSTQPAAARRTVGPAPSTRRTREKAEVQRKGAVGPANFNAQNLIHILRFCMHDHALQLLVDPVGRMGGDDDDDEGCGAAAVRTACIDAVAQAHWLLLDTALYWAPLLRSYQMAMLLQVLAVTWQNTAPPAAVTVTKPLRDASETLDRVVGLRVAEQLLRRYPDPAALQDLLGHLLRAMLRYADMYNAGAFASAVKALCQLVTAWPPAFAGAAGGTGLAPALPHFAVLAAAPMELIAVDEFLRTGWTTLECGLMFSSQNIVADEAGDATGSGEQAVSLRRRRQVALLPVRLTQRSAHTTARGSSDGDGGPAAAAGTSFFTHWKVPAYVDEWMHAFGIRRFEPIPPDTLTRLLGGTELLATTLALPSSGGRTSSALLALNLWLRATYAQHLLTGRQVASLAVLSTNLSVAAMRLPTLLCVGRGNTFAPIAASWLRLTLYVLREWMTRVSPLDLYLTRDGRVCSSAALALPAATTTAAAAAATNSPAAAPFPPQTGGEAAAAAPLEERGEALLLSRSRWSVSYLRGETWADAAFSLADLAGVLHTTHLRLAVISTPFSNDTTAAKGRRLRDTSSLTQAHIHASAWLECLVRIAHRLLVVPLSRGNAALRGHPDAQLDADVEVPLATLVVLFLALDPAYASYPARVAETDGGPGFRKNSAARETAMQNFALLRMALCDCRDLCASVLRARLHEAAEVSAASAAAGAEGVPSTRGAPWTAQTLLEVCMMVEHHFSGPTGNTPASGTAAEAAEAAVAAELVAHLKAVLATHLPRWPLRDIAVILSNHPWWTAQRHKAAAAAASAAAPPQATSWLEEALLDTLEARLVATAAESPGDGAATTTPFETHEWVLLPFLLRTEQRLQSRASAASTAALTAVTPSAVHELDDFVELEEALGSVGGVAPAVDATPAASRLAAPFHSLVVLERALNAVVAHCFSFDVLLHVIRCLFLSYPATLSTAPNVAVQLGAPEGVWRKCPAAPGTLPEELASSVEQLAVNAVDLPLSLRERYVDTLYRTFCRLIQLPTAALEDVVEMVHLLWLADPEVSRAPSLVASGVSDGGGGRERGSGERRRLGGDARSSGAGADAAPGWPSLYSRCATYLSDALAADLHVGSDGDDGVSDLPSGGGGYRGREGGRRRVVVPPAIRNLRLTLSSGDLFALLQSLGSDRQSGLAAAQLAPAVVSNFFATLLSQVRAERARDGMTKAASLSAAQRGVLELLTPFMQYSIATTEFFLKEQTAEFLPQLLVLLMELDPQLGIKAIEANAIVSRNNVTSGGFHPGQPKTTSALSALSNSFQEGATSQERSARRLEMLVSTLLLLHCRAFPTAAAAAAAAHTDANDKTLLSTATTVGGGGVAAESTADSDDDGVEQRLAPVAALSGPQRRAEWFIVLEINRELRQPLNWNILCRLDASVLHRILGLRVMRLNRKLWPRMRKHVMQAMFDFRPSPHAADVAEDVPNEGTGATKPLSLSPVGLDLLRCSPLPLLREFLYEHIRYRLHVNYITRERIFESMRERSRSAVLRSVPQRPAGGSRSSGASQENDDAEVARLTLLTGELRGVERGRVKPRIAHLLLLLERSEARYVAEQVLAPTVLFTIAADLMQLLAWDRDLLGTARAAADASTPLTSTSAVADEAGGATAAPLSPSVSYAALRRCASPSSVLREAILQPFLVAACTLLDRLASPDADDFFAVLTRDAEWRRAVRDGPPKKGCSDSGGGGIAEEEEEDGAAKAEGTRLVVLDWKPMLRFVHMLLHVDPGLRHHLEWEASHAGPAVSLPALEAARDVFHGGLEAIAARVGAVWSSASTFVAPAVSPAPTLLIVNASSVLGFCLPYLMASGDSALARQCGMEHRNGDGAFADAAALNADATGGTALDGAAVTRGDAQWLCVGAAGGSTGAGVNDCCMLTANDPQLIPLVHTLRESPAKLAVLQQKEGITQVQISLLVRHARTLRRAGLRLSAREVEDRCGGARRVVAAEAEENAEEEGAAGYWTALHTRLRRSVMAAIFPSLPLGSQPQDPSTVESELERQARQRLELMRCGDLASLLHLLLSEADFAGSASTTAAASLARSSRVRVVVHALDELLPSAAPEEVVLVAEKLLQTVVSLAALPPPAPAASAATATASALRSDAFEMRRLLSSIGVLLANDVERFTRTQVVWLLTRLHTPFLHRASLTPSAMEAAVDVSQSFLSAATARTLAMEFVDTVGDAVEGVAVGDGTAAPRVVTVSTWVAAVAAAETQPTQEHVKALLKLIEATAV